MTSTIKVNTVTTESGSTLTLGGCGKTVALASGASQTGFGRTGTVNWQTTIKTGDFTAVSGEGYFVNTTSGEIDVTLPSSPSAGDIVSLKDYARTWGTSNCIVLRNGSNLDGNAVDNTFSTSGLSITLIYMDDTKGWSLINDDETNTLGAAFIAATGGTITTVCTNFKVHTFTGPGTFCVSQVGNAAGSNTVDYLVVAGGGSSGGDAGGGGGGGGTRFSNGTASGSYCAGPSPLGATALPVTATAFPITVGAGGAQPPATNANTPAPTNAGQNGNPSVFSSITSTAGGGAGGHGPGTVMQGNPGGSGGGARSSGTCAQGGSGNTPPVTPPQGNDGGTGNPQPAQGGGGSGGGGAVGAGSPQQLAPPGSRDNGGPGGTGLTSFITGSNVGYGGGGGGGSGGIPGGQGGTAGQGGGAGASGSTPGSGCGTAGTVNTGGGGGGGYDNVRGQGGGSGIVIIRYKFQ
tara:strand:+ start:1315 stop:2700 length:1386 start_codon:yes stop_codon:yes gene_type:complete